MAHQDASESVESATEGPARGEVRSPPTPVRASLGDPQGDPTPGVPLETTCTLEVDGRSWTVEVGGKSRSGAASASAPILLLVFRKNEDAGEARDAWVVGRSLTDLTDLQLDEAFRRSAPVSEEAWASKPLFPEAGTRGGKDG